MIIIMFYKLLTAREYFEGSIKVKDKIKYFYTC